jgi:hypothetical protein
MATAFGTGFADAGEIGRRDAGHFVRGTHGQLAVIEHAGAEAGQMLGAGTLEGVDGDIALGPEDAIGRGAAAVHLLSQSGFGPALTLHLPHELPGDDAGHTIKFGETEGK